MNVEAASNLGLGKGDVDASARNVPIVEGRGRV
jgi:hypothetical protein